ncbi:hypothetical protein Pmar_PMAR002834 [Perkinsus marinus ATCC 50983]|uniref:Uncharacterized protein n=1 Tax=Perkinsus marinus (strain ATCC 50983 / TXsc) TaxID=423536 RepID=C5LQN4_PERM5|nr:hypothetical protein Pmar_PMAR002834 [Perkinsus marinus ATCC 50983]EER00769.1 hypothetical protein Pmar_PMAR002834 [Perkinsus marinus ATCC 50983]|eukprot:XP_002768051.1 hypothetical protein Pmar_PMAR002834 [Perkinsus marinus ATCC 50983]
MVRGGRFFGGEVFNPKFICMQILALQVACTEQYCGACEEMPRLRRNIPRVAFGLDVGRDGPSAGSVYLCMQLVTREISLGGGNAVLERGEVGKSKRTEDEPPAEVDYI